MVGGQAGCLASVGQPCLLLQPSQPPLAKSTLKASGKTGMVKQLTFATTVGVAVAAAVSAGCDRWPGSGLAPPSPCDHGRSTDRSPLPRNTAAAWRLTIDSPATVNTGTPIHRASAVVVQPV